MIVLTEDLSALKQFSKLPGFTKNEDKESLKGRTFRSLSQDVIDDLVWNHAICPNCWVHKMSNPLCEFLFKLDRAEFNKICLVCDFNTHMNYDSAEHSS